MKTSDVVGLCASCVVLGWAIGLMTNADISYFAGKLNSSQEAKAEAKRWAEEELKRHCVAWHTDRRSGQYMACTKPDWMRNDQ